MTTATKTRNDLAEFRDFYLARCADFWQARTPGDKAAERQWRAWMNLLDMRLALERGRPSLWDRLVLPSLRANMDRVLREQAAVWSDHEDYRREWRP